MGRRPRRHYEFELTPAIWFGLTMCDDESYPAGTKVSRPGSDANVQVPPRPDHAGAAFMELQLSPPGYEPVISCDHVHWCAALTIDSLQAEYGALHGPGSPSDAVANNNCAEHGGSGDGRQGGDRPSGDRRRPHDRRTRVRRAIARPRVSPPAV